MTYLIRPVTFEKEIPSIAVISNKVKESTLQEVIIAESHEFKGQYSIKLSQFPDVLSFEIRKNKIIISGDACDAPALNRILYTVLVNLGGTPLPNLSLLKFPVSKNEIRYINAKARKDIHIFGLVFWLLTLTGIIIICALIYLLFLSL